VNGDISPNVESLNPEIAIRRRFKKLIAWAFPDYDLDSDSFEGVINETRQFEIDNNESLILPIDEMAFWLEVEGPDKHGPVEIYVQISFFAFESRVGYFDIPLTGPSAEEPIRFINHEDDKYEEIDPVHKILDDLEALIKADKVHPY